MGVAFSSSPGALPRELLEHHPTSGVPEVPRGPGPGNFMTPTLSQELSIWKAAWPSVAGREPEPADLLFPGKDPTKHITRQNIDNFLRKACKNLGIEGASTHSFRRSTLTAASDKGVPLRVIQSISGHSSLEMLQRYLDVGDEQKRAAALAFG